MKRVVIRCPYCNGQKFKTIPNDLIEIRDQIDKGIVLFEVPKGIVCEHSFFLEVDKNFAVRREYCVEDLSRISRDALPHYISFKTYATGT